MTDQQVKALEEENASLRNKLDEVGIKYWRDVASESERNYRELMETHLSLRNETLVMLEAALRVCVDAYNRVGGSVVYVKKEIGDGNKE